MSKKNTVDFAHHLVDLFFPLVELSFLDEKGSVKEIFNAFSNIKEDQQCEIKNSQLKTPFLQMLAIGKTVRSLIYPVFEGKSMVGYVRLRFDLTYFKNLQEQLNLLVQKESHSVKPKATTDQWKESIDQIIAHYHSENRINIQTTTAKQKRELFSKLKNQGLFDFKESSAYIASKLQISRATVYNYLKTVANFRKVHIHQVDAFTSQKFAGNPAGVVLDADDLDESSMRKIARELNLSETAFVSSSDKGSFKMRYFTPTGHEISFCGHSTVGALYMIAKERRFDIKKTGHYAFDVQTLCGVLKMEVSIDKDEEIQVAYESPKIKLRQIAISHEEVAKAAGFKLHLVDQSFPVMYEETNKDLFIVVRSLKELKLIECDSKALAQFSKQHDIVVLCLLCPEAFDQQNQFHMRCFAPLVGIPEDPFTGSVLGGLTVYADKFGLLPSAMRRFRVEQGHFMERPGIVEVKFSKDKGNYRVKVFAEAVHCFSTEINL